MIPQKVMMGGAFERAVAIGNTGTISANFRPVAYERRPSSWAVVFNPPHAVEDVVPGILNFHSVQTPGRPGGNIVRNDKVLVARAVVVDGFAGFGIYICASGDDGRSWTPTLFSYIQTGTDPVAFAVATRTISSAGGLFFATRVSVASDGANPDIPEYKKLIRVSADGFEWAFATHPDPRPAGASMIDAVIDVAYGNGKFVAIIDPGSELATAPPYPVLISQTGMTWELAGSIPIAAAFLTFDDVNGLFVAAGLSQTSGVAVSSDGENWTQVASPMTGNRSGLAAANGVLVIAANSGSNFTLSASFDGGASWSTVLSGTQSVLGINVFKKRFYAPTQQTNVRISADGQTWSIAPVPNPPGQAVQNILGVA